MKAFLASLLYYQIVTTYPFQVAGILVITWIICEIVRVVRK